MTEGNNRPISVGDLVMVVHECCPHESSLGEIQTVLSIEHDRATCEWCDCVTSGHHAHLSDAEDNDTFWLPLSWLKRIPPLSELESTKTDEPMKELA